MIGSEPMRLPVCSPIAMTSEGWPVSSDRDDVPYLDRVERSCDAASPSRHRQHVDDLASRRCGGYV